MTPTELLEKHCTVRPLISVQVNAAMEELRIQTWNEALEWAAENWMIYYEDDTISETILKGKLPTP